MPISRDNVFDRVRVDYLIRGASRVEWELHRAFRDPQPHSFQLQVARDGGDEWTDVGTTVSGANFAFDDQHRLRGKDRELVYRVRLTTPNGTYDSPRAHVLGNLNRRQWLQARAVIRRALIVPRRFRYFRGELYKRKIGGDVCTECVDPLTGSIVNSDCTACSGTGQVRSYWRSGAQVLYDRSPTGRDVQRDDRQARGTVNDAERVLGTFVGLPLVSRRDFWVDLETDQRWFVHSVRNQAEINGVPLVVTAELRVAQHDDIVYNAAVGA